MFEVFHEILDELDNAEKQKDQYTSESAKISDNNMFSLLESNSDKAQAHKELQSLLNTQTNENQTKIKKQNNIFSDQKDSLESQDNEENSEKVSLFSKIKNLQSKLKSKGKVLPAEMLMDFAAVKESDSGSKLIVDKSLSFVYSDLADILGEDSVVLNRREDDRRTNTDRRSDNYFINNDDRSDTAGRRHGDRREDNNFFLS